MTSATKKKQTKKKKKMKKSTAKKFARKQTPSTSPAPPNDTSSAPSVAPLPTRTAEKVLEDKSRAIFTEQALPWMVTDWTQHDLGIDAIVEIALSRSNGENFDATGKRFAVQLKATENDVDGRESVPVRIRPEQVRYWIESTEPVILLLCHIPTRRFFWRWIDHHVVDELNQRDPAWMGQERVSVHMSCGSLFDANARKEIAKRVAGFRPASRRMLAPGAYQELQTSLVSAASSLVQRARVVGFESVTKRLADVENALRASTYVVAFAGPARAGKSTLLNALVGREVSPVGRLPTTAVSLMVMSGERDESEVVLATERVRGDASAAFLAQYATQEKNPDNVKGVRMIAVRLVSEQLARGVAYADAPGLHDPSAAIQAVTEAALKSAHAIFYVLDVSPAKHGGFSLSTHHVEDLKRLRAMAHRLFIVFNKADVLEENERHEVSGFAQATLTKFGLWDSLPRPPIFTSAKNAWAWHAEGRTGNSPLAELEDAVWEHLLATNSTGLDRLVTHAAEVQRAGRDFASLLATRRANGTQAAHLRSALGSCRERERELVGACRQRQVADKQRARDSISEAFTTLLVELRQRLDRVPVNEPLPSTEILQQDLQSHAIVVLRNVWAEMSTRFQLFATHVSVEVEKSLSQARLETGGPSPEAFLVPQVPALNIRSDSFEEAWTGLFTGGLFGLFLLGGAWGLALAAGGWLAGLLLGRERQRKRQIDGIVERATSSLQAALDNVHHQISERVRVYSLSLERHITDRISVFAHDVERQLQQLGTPLSPSQSAELDKSESEVNATLQVVDALQRRLGGH